MRLLRQPDKPYKLVKALQNGAREPSLPKGDRPTATEPRLFYSDRQGDEYNIRYGSLHKGDIPRYRRLGGELDVTPSAHTLN